MDHGSIEHIYTGWDSIKATPNYKEEFGALIFSRINKSSISPHLGAKFANVGNSHAKLFGGMLDLIVHMLGPDLEPVMDQLEVLGQKHASYGITSQHYPIFGEALMHVLAHYLGSQQEGDDANYHWNNIDEKDAWLCLWRFVALHMIRGATSTTNNKPPTSPTKKKTQKKSITPTTTEDSSKPATLPSQTPTRRGLKHTPSIRQVAIKRFASFRLPHR